jgi:hypothetical protein
MATNGGKENLPTLERHQKKSRKITRWRHAMSESGEGEKKGGMVFTEWDDNVDDFFVDQLGRDGTISGGGGGPGSRRRPGKLLGDDWDGHRGEGDDDDQQIEALPEEGSAEPSKEGHDDLVSCLRWGGEGGGLNNSIVTKKTGPLSI